MDDDSLHRRIDELVAEEHRLERAHVGTALSAQEKERSTRSACSSTATGTCCARAMPAVAGQDPDAAQARDTGVVEGYRQ